jgi:hypothetical protein
MLDWRLHTQPGEVTAMITFKGHPAVNFPPAFSAQRIYNEGGGLEDNPYPRDSLNWEKFQWEMHRLQLQELRDMLEAL